MNRPSDLTLPASAPPSGVGLRELVRALAPQTLAPHLADEFVSGVLTPGTTNNVAFELGRHVEARFTKNAPPPAGMHRLPLDLPDAYWSRLQALAAARGRSPEQCLLDFVAACQPNGGKNAWKHPEESGHPKKAEPPAKEGG